MTPDYSSFVYAVILGLLLVVDPEDVQWCLQQFDLCVRYLTIAPDYLRMLVLHRYTTWRMRRAFKINTASTSFKFPN
jgi:hypothetical protein